MNMPRDDRVAHGRELREHLADEQPGLDAVPTGIKILYNELQLFIFRSFLSSFALALVLITGTIALASRSWRVGLVSMVPNVLPIVWILAGFGKNHADLTVR